MGQLNVATAPELEEQRGPQRDEQGVHRHQGVVQRAVFHLEDEQDEAHEGWSHQPPCVELCVIMPNTRGQVRCAKHTATRTHRRAYAPSQAK